MPLPLDAMLRVLKGTVEISSTSKSVFNIIRGAKCLG